jgi:hypothetical protein
MNKEDTVRIAVPRKLIDIVDKLTRVRVGDAEVVLHTETAIIKEALVRGLRLMMIEREVIDELAEKAAHIKGVRVYTSLVREAKGTPSGGKIND